MNGPFIFLKITLAILLLAGSLPLRAATLQSSRCDVRAETISLKNVNLDLNKINEGDTLYTSQLYNIHYTCESPPTTTITYYAPTLVINDSFKPVITAMKNQGLGINITIKEQGMPEERIKWDYIKNPHSGYLFTRKFGAEIPKSSSVKTSRDATIKLELFVDTSYPKSMLVLNIPPLAALNIMTNDKGYGQPGVPVNTSGFSIRFLPDNLGQVTVSPQVVKLGHFYTTSEATLTKRVPFTVTALQKLGAGVPFSVPLMINFIPESKLTVQNNQFIKLINNDGIANGLKLSLRKDSMDVPLNTPVQMGTIDMGYPPAGNVPVTYTAVVEPVEGEEIKTGDFTASMSVVVTYN